MSAHFQISDQPLDCVALEARLEDFHSGATVVFTGRVRGHNEGQAVAALEYEAFAPLAEKEGTRILMEARTQFAIDQIGAVHRVGRLNLGEIAVWVGVSAAHRGAAFDACRYIIDELKARVPIWKKEHYLAGASQWINCATRGPWAEGDATPPNS